MLSKKASKIIMEMEALRHWKFVFSYKSCLDLGRIGADLLSALFIMRLDYPHVTPGSESEVALPVWRL